MLIVITQGVCGTGVYAESAAAAVQPVSETASLGHAHFNDGVLKKPSYEWNNCH